jgi:hypothetical protein
VTDPVCECPGRYIRQKTENHLEGQENAERIERHSALQNFRLPDRPKGSCEAALEREVKKKSIHDEVLTVQQFRNGAKKLPEMATLRKS